MEDRGAVIEVRGDVGPDRGAGLAFTVLYVPYSLDSGTGGTPDIEETDKLISDRDIDWCLGLRA
jgi:hypothetical protein